MLFVAFNQLLVLSQVEISFRHCFKENYELVVFSLSQKPCSAVYEIVWERERCSDLALHEGSPHSPPSVSDDSVLADCFCSTLLSSHSSLKDEVGVDGGLAVFPLSFCMKNNFSVGSNGCCTLIRPHQVFILTSIIRLGDFMG